jgi:DNA polymerase-3 subunit delta'
VRPEALEDDVPAAEGDDDPAEEKKTKSKSASKEIKIEQVRALSDFMNISTHRQGLRVVVLYPAESLNMPASNALLKTLEEPPAGTVFLLASNGLDRLLPTILSRCRKFALTMPDHGEALAWLEAQGVNDADGWLREQGGAPLAALAQAETGSREELDGLLQVLAQPSVDAALRSADKLSKAPLAALVAWQQRWLYDVFSYKLSGVIRYYPRYQREVAALAGRVHVADLMQAIKSTNDRRAVADHPLSPKLFVEDMLLDYTARCGP